MSAIPELPRPGVEVLQEYETTTPTTVVPTLVPCVMGVCKEIHELYDSSNVLNSDVLVDGPAVAIAPNAEASYTSMDAETLQVRVSGGVIQEFTMPTGASPPTTMTAQEVASAINGATPAPVGFSASVYTDDSSDNYLQLETTATGEDVTLQIVGGTLAGASNQFGWGVGYTYYGLGSYIQDAIYLPQAAFPDPRGNLDELDIDEDTIRVFLNLSTEVREILDSESFLRNGGGTADDLDAVDDGDGDQTTPLVLVSTSGSPVNLKGSPSSAQEVGTVDCSSRIYLHNKTLDIQLDGAGPQTVQFVGDPVVSEATGALFPWTGGFTVNVNGTAVAITLTSIADLAGLVTAINSDAGVVALGVGNIAFASDANGNAGSTNLGLIVGGAPATPVANTEIQVTAETTNDLFLTASLPYQQTLESTGAGPRDDIATQIDNLFETSIASYEATTNYLVLDSPSSGVESKLELLSTSTALTALGVTAGSYYGNPFETRVGDALYGDGALVGNIIEVEPGAVTGRVKLDREVALTYTATDWYIVAKNLDTVPSAQYGSTVPTPDLVVDANGDVTVKHDFLRDTKGDPVVTTAAAMYVIYEALRLDVTPDADEPSLLSFDTTDDLEDALGPLVPENPLAYGLYLALQNSGTTSVYGIGVGATSADKPYGTVTAWSEAFDFLESQEVYALALMTTDLEVALSCQTHVDAMSEATAKKERVGIFHLGLPTRKVDTLVASGNDGDYMAGGPPDFDTKIATLSAALLAEGVDPTSITVADGVFLDIASDSNNWNITGSITNGTQVAINTSFGAGENDDSFYATGTFPTDLVSESFSVKIRGALVSNKDDEVTTVYNRGVSFLDRRMWLLQCNQMAATVNGVEQLIPGFFVCAAKAGMVGGLPPANGFTNFPIAGFTRVTGTNDRYSETQLNQMAAGGVDLIIQDDDTSPVISRHQLTTNVTSLEEREQSIVKAVDYCAKFYRATMKLYIGRYNITPSFLDTLSSVAQGAGRWLVEEGKVVGGADLNNLIQSSTNPDTVLVDVSLDPLYPCNTIRVTLIV